MTAVGGGPTAFRAAVLAAAAALVVFVVAPPAARLWLLCLAPLGAASVVVLQVCRLRPARTGAWLLLAAALAITAAGSTVQAERHAFTGFVWVSFATGSAATGASIVVFTSRRQPEHDRFAWLDSAIGLVSLATVAYQFLVQPYVLAGAGAAAILSAAATPFLDLTLVGLLLRMRDRRPRRSVALAVLVAALCAAVGSDTVVGLATIGGQYGPGSIWDLFSFVSSLAVGTAALHPSMVQVGLPAPGPAPSRVPGLLLLTPAGAVVPFLALGSALGWLRLDLRLAALAGLVLFVLAMARAVQLLAATERASLHDELTGLANLRRFRREMTRSVATPGGPATMLAMLDLDDFKTVNDTYGHTVGDALLVEVAGRLRAAFPPPSLVARFGGDEFGVLAVTSESAAVRLSEEVGARVLSAFAEPFLPAGVRLHVSASVGIVVSPQVDTLERLQSDADVAMYAAKNAGRASYRVYSPTVREQVVGQRRLADDLERALDDPASGGLWVAYQPVVAIDTGRLVSVEALVRWSHPVRGLLAPGDFLPTAQAAGMSAAVDEFVLTTALHQLAAWEATSPALADIRLAVNATAASLARRDLAPRVLGALAAAGLRPERLTVEITEQAAVADDAQLAAALRELTAAGVELAIDDFGTGYSALLYLERFPVSVLKLDRSLVATSVDVHPSRLLAAVTALARSLDMTLVAEGVENRAQLAALRELDVSLVQGFLFAPPLPADEVQRYADTHGVRARQGVLPQPWSA